jgi:F0F1-type ATP synthase assembly protein I
VQRSVSGPEGDSPKQNDARQAASWLRGYAQVFEFLATLGLLGYAGYRLDQHYKWQRWGLLVGLLVGMVLGLYRLVRESGRPGR